MINECPTTPEISVSLFLCCVFLCIMVARGGGGGGGGVCRLVQRIVVVCLGNAHKYKLYCLHFLSLSISWSGVVLIACISKVYLRAVHFNIPVAMQWGIDFAVSVMPCLF